MEVAALLKLAENTVHAVANAGELPAFKNCERWPVSLAGPDRCINEGSRIGNEGRDAQ